MLSSAQNDIETAGVAAYLGRYDLLRRLCFTSTEVARTFESYETMAMQILGTQVDARERQVADVGLRRLDATRLGIVHERPLVSPWVYIITM
jgi:hypothetical protein